MIPIPKGEGHWTVFVHSGLKLVYTAINTPRFKLIWMKLIEVFCFLSIEILDHVCRKTNFNFVVEKEQRSIMYQP